MGQCLVLVGFGYVASGGAELGAFAALAGSLGVVALLVRGDVVALQVGRRITYEVHPDRLLVLRAGEPMSTVQFDEVQQWTTARPASTFDFWIARGRCRSWGPANARLDRFSFTVRQPGGDIVVRPPALFRWADRGGLDDVVDVLTQRIGRAPTDDPGLPDG